MKIILLTLLIHITFFEAKSQDTIVKYYNNQWLEKEVSPNKAKFILKKFTNEDGSETTQTIKKSNNEIQKSYTYKDKIPYGIWVIQYGKGTKELDYNFTLKYLDENCELKNEYKTDKYFIDNQDSKYEAPKLSKEAENEFENISQNIIYPSYAIENDISGNVELCYTITENGSIDNIYVYKGIMPLLDKEAVRVLKLMKYESGAKLNGKPTSICLKTQISFKLE